MLMTISEPTPIAKTSKVNPAKFSPLRSVMVYDDSEMAIRGKSAFDLYAKEMEEGEPGELSIWRFDMLDAPELHRAAVELAEAADMIIVATRDSRSLPDSVSTWLEHWPARRKSGAGAVVAVFDPATSAQAAASDVALLLWRAAERAGMDFFCAAPARHTSPIQPHSAPVMVTQIGFDYSDPATATSTWHGHTSRHCGINE